MSSLTYREIFGKLVRSAYDGNIEEEIQYLNPDGSEVVNRYVKHAAGRGESGKIIFKVRDCRQETDCRENECQAACLFNAITKDEKGNVVIDDECCTTCGECVEACKYDSLIDKKEFIPIVELLKNKKAPVYAIVAPAFIGQFGEHVTPGKLRAALKRLGFYGMVEVALFADMLTLKEALEFDTHVQQEGDFVLTSCCCPLWVAMIKKVYQDLVPHISPSVSPMVACGRGVKKMHPEAKVVFIGPCIAKKAEAKEKDVKDAVDVVLTFQEIAQIFEVLGIKPEEMEDDEREHSSNAGRIYARTGGVSEAVTLTLERIRPDREMKIITAQANGVKECRKLLQDALDQKIEANFYEGMGCLGGCIGGPKVRIDPGQAAELVDEYGKAAESATPADNKYVLELLKVLGYQEISELLEGRKANLFKRNFAPTLKETLPPPERH